jgi:anthranilate/para-aminobenzoate synthase component I
MITDLLRNDLGQFCQAGSVKVTELCALHSFGNVPSSDQYGARRIET